MEHPEQYYLIPKSLDNGRLLMGLPIEEALPALVCLGVGFLIGHEMVGFLLGVFLLFSVRYVKGRYGANVFIRTLYYYFTSSQWRRPFKRLPPAGLRYWRS